MGWPHGGRVLAAAHAGARALRHRFARDRRRHPLLLERTLRRPHEPRARGGRSSGGRGAPARPRVGARCAKRPLRAPRVRAPACLQRPDRQRGSSGRAQFGQDHARRASRSGARHAVDARVRPRVLGEAPGRSASQPGATRRDRGGPPRTRGRLAGAVEPLPLHRHERHHHRDVRALLPRRGQAASGRARRPGGQSLRPHLCLRHRHPLRRHLGPLGRGGPRRLPASGDRRPERAQGAVHHAARHARRAGRARPRVARAASASTPTCSRWSGDAER